MTRGRKKGSYSKWSPERVSQIVEMARTGMSYSEIGATMGEQGHVIRNLLNRYGVYVTRKDVGQSRWQPIKTAPMYEMVLVCVDGEVTIAQKVPQDHVFDFEFLGMKLEVPKEGIWIDPLDGNLPTIVPEHWMPLPKPPKE